MAFEQLNGMLNKKFRSSAFEIEKNPLFFSEIYI